eukprot:3987101-Lingulodinium_polyedra.AAC.1
MSVISYLCARFERRNVASSVASVWAKLQSARLTSSDCRTSEPAQTQSTSTWNGTRGVHGAFRVFQHSLCNNHSVRGKVAISVSCCPNVNNNSAR